MKAGLLSSPRQGWIMAAIAVGLALVICGAIAAQSSTAPSVPGVAATTRPCQAGQLRVLVDPSVARRTADGTYLPIDFLNKWLETCEFRGYTAVTGVATVTGHDARAVHVPGAVTSVVLGQNYAAHTWVLIANAPGGRSAGCRQLTAKGLRVDLPRTTTHLWIAYPFTACAGGSQALLSIRPVVQGLANPTSFP
jgi:hypothetical protein